MPQYRLAFMGFGNVGKSLARLLLDKRAELDERYGIEVIVTGIFTSRHGATINPQGIDLAQVLDLLGDPGGRLDGLATIRLPADGFDFLDGGPCPIGVESTIVSMGGTWPELLRPGTVTLAALRTVIGPVVRTPASRTMVAPGHLLRHYATCTPMTILAAPEVRPVLHAHERAGLLAMSTPGHGDERFCAIEVLSASGDMREAARNLFAALRWLDALGLDRLYAVPCEDQGLGLAIMDRLRRCAAPLK